MSVPCLIFSKDYFHKVCFLIYMNIFVFHVSARTLTAFPRLFVHSKINPHQILSTVDYSIPNFSILFYRPLFLLDCYPDIQTNDCMNDYDCYCCCSNGTIYIT